MTTVLLNRNEKMQVFRMSASAKCPACGGRKTRLHWLCVPCQALVDGSPENDALTVACSTHAVTARALVDLAKTKTGGPI